METATRRARSVNLTAALVAVAALELCINRVGGRLFFPRATLAAGGSGSHTGHLLGAMGPFLFQLTAILTLGLLVAAFFGLLRRGELYPRQMRFSVVAIALVFAGFCGQALVRGHITARYFVHLATAFGFLGMLTAGAFARTQAAGRVKLAVFLFALPGILHAFARISSSWLRGAGIASVLAGAGEVALIAAAIASPFLLSPYSWQERMKTWRFPLAVAGTLTAVMMFVLVVRFDLLQTSVLYGLRIDLPRPGSVPGVAHVIAFFCWTFATTELLRQRGGTRLAGYGLILLALGGYEAGSPVELSLSLLGLLALSVGQVRAAPARAGTPTTTRVETPRWRDFVRRLATAAQSGEPPDDTRPEAIVVADGEMEVSRIRSHRRGHLVSIKLLRKRGTLVELDATVGTQGHGLPDASIERHRRWLARSPELRLKLERQKTGDADFDQTFSVHGEAPLRDDELRHRLAGQQGDGVVTIWRGGAARYVVAQPSSAAGAPVVFSGETEGDRPVGSIVAILDTLADLVEASRPTT
jgi:hypothetical protein